MAPSKVSVCFLQSTNSIGCAAKSQMFGKVFRARHGPSQYLGPCRQKCSPIRCEAADKPWRKKDARLVLEDGSVYRGSGFGAVGTKVGEVVFNTSLTGYQEIMTDPSYKGQFVCFTHPHIGNVGVNPGGVAGRLNCIRGI